MKRIVSALVSLALVFVLAACGSSTSADSGSTTAATTSPNASSTATMTASPYAEASPAGTATSSKISGDLTIFAAASLTEAFTDMKTELEAANPGMHITLNFAGSSALRTQILQGASTDLFASADTQNMDPVVQAGDVKGEPSIFAQNRLVIVVPANNPGNVNSVKDLAKAGLKLVLAQEQVPVGNYARQSLDKLSADPTYGSDFKAKVLANLASNELNVKDVLAKVQLGEADAGIVYATDAAAADQSKIKTIDIPQQFNIIAQYPIGVVKSGSNPDGARAFIDELLSPAGQAIMAKYGFIAPPAP
jgi:molybdate transport system substrate-binding protein